LKVIALLLVAVASASAQVFSANYWRNVPYAASAMQTSTPGGPQVILQSNAVDVETDGGFVVSLPTPPNPVTDLPDFAEEFEPRSPVNQVIAHQRMKISLLERSLAHKKQALSNHDTWLEQAARSLERVMKQMRETKRSRKAIVNKIKALENERVTEIKATTRHKIVKELDETRNKLTVLKEEADAVHAAKLAIGRKRASISRAALKIGKALGLHKNELKAKIQQFEDEESRLGHVGGDDTPHSISNIDSLLIHDEDIRMADNDH